MESTEFIILRKTPYSESSLVVSGLSLEFGKLDFMIRGARRIDKKKFPFIDLFREINVIFRKRNEGLQNLHSAELLNSYDGIAMQPENYMEICRIAAFVLKNTHPDAASPKLYAALKNALSNFSRKTDNNTLLLPDFTGSLVKLVFLHEHGLLPEIPENTGTETGREKKKILELFLSSAIEGGAFPETGENYRRKICAWINSLCAYHNLI